MVLGGFFIFCVRPLNAVLELPFVCVVAKIILIHKFPAVLQNKKLQVSPKIPFLISVKLR